MSPPTPVEYMTLVCPDDNTLCAYAKMGWRLVLAPDQNVRIMMREIPDQTLEEDCACAVA